MTLAFDAGFRSRPNRRGEDGSDDDQRVLALAFRDRMEWAIGHNTSIEAPVERAGNVAPPDDTASAIRGAAGSTIARSATSRPRWRSSPDSMARGS